MTKAQVVRRKFKSALPRRIQNRALSKMEALARTIELFDRLRDGMAEAGLDRSDVEAGLVYCQPETKGKEHVLAETVKLPTPEKIGSFVDRVMALDKPLFLGVLLKQDDREAEKAEQRSVWFIWPFMLGPEADGRLIMARNQQVQGGFKRTAN